VRLLRGTDWIFTCISVTKKAKGETREPSKKQSMFLEIGNNWITADVRCLILWTHQKQTELPPGAARAVGVISVRKNHWLRDYHGLIVSLPWTEYECTVNWVWAYREPSVSVPWTECECAMNWVWAYRELSMSVPWTESECTVNWVWVYPYCGETLSEVIKWGMCLLC
jgi:hypothetical protein